MTKEAKIYSGIDNLFSKWFWENCTTSSKVIKLDYCLTPYIKIKPKYIKDLM